MSFSPYVFFSGNCAEAFQRYHEIFGGELTIMTHEQLPPDAEPMPGAEPHTVMHASITIGDSVLMGSDDPTGNDGPKTGVAVTYSAPEPEDARKVFDELFGDGEVMMPFEATFFSRGFGAGTDRFGVQWMVDTVGEP